MTNINIKTLWRQVFHPDVSGKKWRLVGVETDADAKPFTDTLIAALLALYWEWRRYAGDKPWRPDNYDDQQ